VISVLVAAMAFVGLPLMVEVGLWRIRGSISRGVVPSNDRGDRVRLSTAKFERLAHDFKELDRDLPRQQRTHIRPTHAA
jgi:hypothetical protein